MFIIIVFFPIGLKACMVRAYEYIDGVEDILYSLKQNNYEVHAFTNYPVWWVSTYLDTFVHMCLFGCS
jgi:hypothetical protein